MTKIDFVKKAKELGFERFKDLVSELGYHQRTLDRYKDDDNISIKIQEALDRFISKKGSLKSTQKPTQKKVKITQKQPTQNQDTQVTQSKEVHKEKTTQKEVKITQNKTPKDTQNDATQKECVNIGLDIPNEVYHSSNKLGASKIKLILENAKEFQKRYITKEIDSPKTEALLLGSLHHTLVSEPHKLSDEYIIVDLPPKPLKQDYVRVAEDLGVKLEYKESTKGELVASETIDEIKLKIDTQKNKIDKSIITQKQYEIAKNTSQKALNSYFVVEAGAKTLLKAKLRDILQLPDCYVEKTFYGVIDGVEIQVRPDILVNLSKENKIWFVIDLKTSTDATSNTFMQQSSKYYYDIQEYVYTEILRQNGIVVKDFRFCVAGKSEHSGCEYYQLHKEDIEDAEKIVKQIIKKYKYCLENDVWEEGRFNYEKLRFEPVATIKMPTYRKFQMIDLGVM